MPRGAPQSWDRADVSFDGRAYCRNSPGSAKRHEGCRIASGTPPLMAGTSARERLRAAMFCLSPAKAIGKAVLRGCPAGWGSPLSSFARCATQGPPTILHMVWWRRA